MWFDLLVRLYALIIVILAGGVVTGLSWLMWVGFLWVLERVPDPVAIFSHLIYEFNRHARDLHEENRRHRQLTADSFTGWLADKIATEEGYLKEVSLRG